MATVNFIEWLNFNNIKQEMTLKYGMTQQIEGYETPAKKKVSPIKVSGRDYKALFGLMGKITIDEKEYTAPLGLIVSYLASCAIKQKHDDWEFSEIETNVFGDAGLEFLNSLVEEPPGPII